MTRVNFLRQKSMPKEKASTTLMVPADAGSVPGTNSIISTALRLPVQTILLHGQSALPVVRL